MKIKKYLKSLCFWVQVHNLDSSSYDYVAIFNIIKKLKI